MSTSKFADRPDKHQLETGTVFSPKFDKDGLLPAIATDAKSGDVLMLAYMNEQALALTIETGIAHYWSRSRNQLWKKGETSGNLQRIIELRTDCDQDAIWMSVEQQGKGAACHVGYKSCFFRAIPTGYAPLPDLQLDLKEDAPLFDPKEVYGKKK
ncbi:MAG: phosphoribosyl-AMP cyclohydrolase [bacterium]|nr:phosphoribosyl-AMP cyclohydrolase [bacterium]